MPGGFARRGFAGRVEDFQRHQIPLAFELTAHGLERTRPRVDVSTLHGTLSRCRRTAGDERHEHDEREQQRPRTKAHRKPPVRRQAVISLAQAALA
jgi:hypothetical protein